MRSAMHRNTFANTPRQFWAQASSRSRETRGLCSRGDTGPLCLPSSVARLERRSTVKSNETSVTGGKMEEMLSFMYSVSRIQNSLPLTILWSLIKPLSDVRTEHERFLHLYISAKLRTFSRTAFAIYSHNVYTFIRQFETCFRISSNVRASNVPIKVGGIV